MRPVYIVAGVKEGRSSSVKWLFKLSFFVPSLLISFVCHAAIHYVPSPSQVELQRSLQSVQSEEKQLQNEIHVLQNELRGVKKRKVRAKTKAKKDVITNQQPPKAHLPEAPWLSSATAPEEEKEEEAVYLGKQPYGYSSWHHCDDIPLIRVKISFRCLRFTESISQHE